MANTPTIQANQIADAIVAAPAVSVEALRYVPGGNRDIDTGDTSFETLGTDEADEAEAEFVVPFSGTYKIVYRGSGFGVLAAGVTAQWQLLFDESGFGGWTEQAISDDWKVYWATDGEMQVWTYAEQTVELDAGTHKVAIQGKHLSGSATVRCNANTIHNVVLTYASGSGAGGTLVDSYEMLADDAIDGNNTAWQQVNDGTNDVQVEVSVTADDYVSFPGGLHVDISGAVNNYLIGVGIGSADPTPEMTVQYGSNDLSFELSTIPFPGPVQLGAGTYTLKLKAKPFSAVASSVLNIRSDSSRKTTLFAKVYRGGLVPVQQAGTTVTDTPRAFNFLGAAVEDNNGVADIHLGASAPGVLDVDGAIPTSSVLLDTTDTYKQIYPAATARTFTPLVDGVHRVDLGFMVLLSNDANFDNFQFKVELDDGTNPAIVVGDDDSWVYRKYVGGADFYIPLHFQGRAELTGGQSYDVKAYGKRVGSASTYVTIPNSSRTVQVAIESVTGSGAGGELIEDSDPDATAVPLTKDVEATIVTDTITIAQSDAIQVDFTGWARKDDAGNQTELYVRLYAGGSLVGPDPLVRLKPVTTTTTDRGNISFSRRITGLGAGTHTIEVRGLTQGGASGADVDYNAYPSSFQLSIARGGLVPVQENGVTKTSTPAALNFIGDNATVTNVGGKANIDFNGVAQGLDPEEFTMGATFSTTSATFVAVTDSSQGGADFAVTVTVDEGERVLLTGKLALAATGGSGGLGANVGIGVDGSDPSGPMSNTIAAQTGENFPVPLSFLSDSLDAGSHTFRIMARRSSGTPTLEVRGTATSTNVVSNLQAARVRGGYVKPENVPILEYSSASVINVTSAPGADSTLRVLLNDGVRYTATSPLTVDLTTSGLGGLDTGSETSSTWYYVYAVPGATEGAIGVVASTSDPDTGPTGYAAYRYIGPLYNDSSGDILKTHQYDNYFAYNTPPSIGSTVGPVTRTSLDLSAYCPATAGLLRVMLRTDYNTAPGGTKLYAPGATNITVFSNAENGASPRNVSAEMPVGGSPRGFDWEIDSGVNGNLYFQGFTDKYLRGAVEARAQSEPLVDNIPRLEYSSASVVNVAAAPGASSTLRVTLSDGKHYTATAPLSVDLTTSGLGGLDTGSEASSTWYNIFAVPSATSGVFDVVGSTALSSVGPTGFTEWKHLGWIRNDSSSNILKFYHVTKDQFFYDVAQTSISSISGDSAWANLDVSGQVPPGTELAQFQGYVADGHIGVAIDGSSSTALGLWLGPGQTGWTWGSAPIPVLSGIVEWQATQTPTDGYIQVRGWHDAELG